MRIIGYSLLVIGLKESDRFIYVSDDKHLKIATERKINVR
ncbi:hypothetical protein D1AOALGA4SA_9735 [Olavius algarvensis Delta 1 endosymbiont]|nr:hypothetical protein D1AOALGA4SA_9735 [Olavius algarvensis Delta 1 endosymbiont]